MAAATFGTRWPSEAIRCQAEMRINEQVELRDYSAQWRYKVPWGTNTWVDVDNNQEGCRLYVVLNTPRAPQQVPWPEVLDISCIVAFCCAEEKEAMDRIWGNFYYEAGGLYDVGRYRNGVLVAGYPEYTFDQWSAAFDLTSWLDLYPNVGIVNCYDMAKALVVFANALGCQARYSYVGNFGFLNCVSPIGRDWTNNPFYNIGVLDPSTGVNPSPVVNGNWGRSHGRRGFGNHAFARIDEWIYDASVGSVDVDLDPDDGPIHLYGNLNGDDTWTNAYAEKVIDREPNDYGDPSIPLDYTFNVY